MTTRRQRAGFAGVTKLRKTLRRLEPEAKQGIKDSFRDAAERIHYDSLVNLRSKVSGEGSGDLAASIGIKYGRDGFTAVIGPGADTVKINKSPFNTALYVSKRAKHDAWQFFKGYWFEFGTKGNPGKNIPPQPARPFMNPAYDANKGELMRDLQGVIAKTLTELSQGSDNG